MYDKRPHDVPLMVVRTLSAMMTGCSPECECRVFTVRVNAMSLPRPLTTESSSVYISTASQLTAFCEQAARESAIAVDTEFLREHTYFPKLCLVQIAAGNTIVSIDPLAIEDLTPLKDLLQNPGVVKIFHACEQDLEAIYDAMECTCTPIFDTQIAAGFLGMRQQVGYANLVEARCGVSLSKAGTLTDWSRRPLDEAQIRYAEDDVRYLVGIYNKMVAELTAAGRLSWVEEEIAATAAQVRTFHEPHGAYKRLRRSSSLTRRQLAIAREVAAWREKRAAQTNRPRRRLLADEVVIEICRSRPKSIGQMRRVRGVDQLATHELRELICAVERGLACPDAECPEIKRSERPSTDEECVLDLMYATLRLCCEREKIAPQLVACKDDLLTLLRGRKDCALLHDWRWQVAGESLMQLLDGKTGVTVVNGALKLLRV